LFSRNAYGYPVVIEEAARGFAHEIIIVDNGSVDSTLNIAKGFGAKVLQDSTKTIAGLRNMGAAEAIGKVFVFLDADVMLTPAWAEEFDRVHKVLIAGSRVVTGSRCGISTNPSWIEKHWFLAMTQEIATYINSGHLIIQASAFKEIGGFNDNLITGEDWEFSMRAKQKNFSVLNNPKLEVIHEGYPKSLRSFILRESWHGIQDFQSVKSFFGSKVAMAAMFYWIFLLAGLALTLYLKSIIWIIVAVAINAMICLVATSRKRMRYKLNILPYFLLFNVYFFSRGLSALRRLLGQRSIFRT
jgi:glycosyltransferase involved in cell wall biosynthesis